MYDLFISHATEDKEEFVRPLAVALSQLGITVWYDEFSLTVGDSLSRSIDKGLIDSRFGLVVLSNSFFDKKWTDYELRSLISKEIAYDKVILPIWHNITRNELINFSPYLADKFALNSSNKNIEEIVLELCKIVQPQIYNNLSRIMLHEQLYEGVVPNDIIRAESVTEFMKKNPPKHKTLPVGLINRIKIMHHLFKFFSFTSLDETINNFCMIQIR